MSNDPNLEGAANSQPQPETGAAPEWNGGYQPQQPEQPQQWNGGYAPQQPEQPQQWNGGYQPQQPEPQWNGGYQQPQQQWSGQGYGQQQYQGGYQQPRAPRAPRAANPAANTVKIPGFVPKEKLPVIVRTLLCAFAGLMVLLFINNISLINTVWYNVQGYYTTQNTALMILSGLFAMGGAACLALGPMLKKPLFAAIGSFVAAVGVLLAGIGYIVTKSYSLRWMDIVGGSLVILSSFALVIVGLHYLLKGSGVTAALKQIACYAGFGCAVLGVILCAIPALYNIGSTGLYYSILYGVMHKNNILYVTGAVTGSVLWLVFALLGLAAATAGLLMYNPAMQEFRAEAPREKKGPVPMWLATGTAKIMACVFAGCALVTFVFSIIVFRFVPFFSLLLWLAAGVMMILGTFLNRKCEFFFAIGVFLAAVGALTFMYADGWYVSLFLFVQFLCLLGVGAYYLFKRRIVNEKQKALLTYIAGGIGAAAGLFHVVMLFVDTSSARIKIDALALILNLLVLFTAVALFLAIFFYRPFTKPVQRAPQPGPGGYGQGYGGGYPQQGYPQQNPYGQGMPNPPQGYAPQQPVQNPQENQQGGQYY